MHCRGRCWLGMGATGANCPGGRTATPTGCGSLKPCCNRRAWQRCWSTIASFWKHFRRLRRWPWRRRSGCWRGGAGWATIAAHACCTGRRRVVVSELGGVIPRAVEGLRKLPGVGRYTASAIASIAFGEPSAVVDGNVERVLSRMDGEPRTGAAAWKRAEELLDRHHPGDWNQAMMELGATICTPRSPQCLVCPVRLWCQAPGAETQKPKSTRKRVQMTRVLIERSGRVYLVQRAPDVAQMAGMWELPVWRGPKRETGRSWRSRGETSADQIAPDSACRQIPHQRGAHRSCA